MYNSTTAQNETKNSSVKYDLKKSSSSIILLKKHPKFIY